MKVKAYKIVRFFRDAKRHNKIIKTGLTLEEAKQHCRNPKTQKIGVWFDGFTEA